MNKFLTASLASLMLLSLSAPAWAQNTTNTNQPYVTNNDTHYGQYHYNYNKHELQVLKQFRELKRTYNRSLEDARQMFLGFAKPCDNSDTEGLDGTRYGHSAYKADKHKMAVLKQFRHLKSAYNRSLEDARQMFLDFLPAPEACTDDDTVDPGDPRPQTLSEPQLVSAWDMVDFYPYAFAIVEGSGNFFVLDDSNRAVVEFDSNGVEANHWYLPNPQWPSDLAVDSTGSVYFLDQNAAESLQKYTPDGVSLPLDPISSLVSPTGLFIDSQDTIYVTDKGGANGGPRVLTLNSYGTILGTFGEVQALQSETYYDIAVDEQNQIVYAVTSSTVAKFDAVSGDFLGSWQGDFTVGYCIAVGGQGQVFIGDINANLIYEYDTNGNLLYTVGSNDNLQGPAHLVVDNAGTLYVVDYFNSEIKIYR